MLHVTEINSQSIIYIHVRRGWMALAFHSQVPLWVARLYSLFDSAIAHRFPQRSAPLSPPDLLQTVAAGSLLWKLDTAQALLDLQFSPIRGQMKEAVELIQKQAKGNDHDHGEK